MTVDLKTQILEDIKKAMKAQDKMRLSTLRLLSAAMKQKEVDERVTLTDPDVLQIIEKMLKQRKDAILQYQAAKRQDLLEKEEQELLTLQHYLPQQLSLLEIEQYITEALESAVATSLKDMGKVMAILKPKLQGRADMAVVSQKLKEKLS